MVFHNDVSNGEIRSRIRHKMLNFAGNKVLKIYGTLNCSSGKRMKTENRVFFGSEEEAVKEGFRPCAHCMKSAYLIWKDGFIRKLH